MVNLGMILAAVLGLGGLLFLTTAKKEGVSVGAEIGELGKGIGELGLGAGRGIAGAIGTPAFTLIEALRGIFQLGADIQGIPRKEDRAGARPSPELPPPYRPPAAEPYKALSGFGILEEGDIAEIIEGVESGIRGVISATGVSERPWRVAGVQNVYRSSELREIQDRLGARAF
mgnify:CR=1 FL=1